MPVKSEAFSRIWLLMPTYVCVSQFAVGMIFISLFMTACEIPALVFRPQVLHLFFLWYVFLTHYKFPYKWTAPKFTLMQKHKQEKVLFCLYEDSQHFKVLPDCSKDQLKGHWMSPHLLFLMPCNFYILTWRPVICIYPNKLSVIFKLYRNKM